MIPALHPGSMRQRVARSIAAACWVVAGTLAPRDASGQGVPPERSAPDTTASALAAAPPSAAECLGFSFGAWTPPLDWRAGGHGADSPGARLPGEFAARDSSLGESELMLFPSWWPAGVAVHFAHTPRVPGDTVPATATALVADGRLRPPRAAARAWLKPCGSGAR